MAGKGDKILSEDPIKEIEDSIKTHQSGSVVRISRDVARILRNRQMPERLEIPAGCLLLATRGGPEEEVIGLYRAVSAFDLMARARSYFERFPTARVRFDDDAFLSDLMSGGLIECMAYRRLDISDAGQFDPTLFDG